MPTVTDDIVDDIVDVDFRSFEEWQSWRSANADFFDARHYDRIAEGCAGNGIVEPLTGRRFSGDDVSWDPSNHRETGLAGGLISRHRATLHALRKCHPHIDKYETKIYGAEALTEFALVMRGHFPKFVGSEFARTEGEVRWLFPIEHQDLLALSYPAETFDIAITNEVLEHVPGLDQALAEIFRILRPGGWHVGTCPFAMMQESSIVKAELRNGEVVHLMEPEFHGNPMSAEGSLVFEIPGWDILARARAIGFSDTFWKLIRSQAHGISANGSGGVLVLCLQR